MKELDAAQAVLELAMKSETLPNINAWALESIAHSLTGILRILNDITAGDGLLVKNGDVR